MIKESMSLGVPYIKVDVEVVHNSRTNGKPVIKKKRDYKIVPSAKKIATYITNQIFGSDIVMQVEDANVNWLMPTLREVLEDCIYSQEGFIYLHKFDDKVYLECIRKNQLFDLVQKYDKVYSCTIVDEDEDLGLELHRKIKLEDGKSYIEIEAYEIDKRTNKLERITLARYNELEGTEYIDKYILPYEVLINIDCGQDFFHDSKKILIEETNILNVIADEVEKTRTRIATSQHYQTGNVVTSWKPVTQFNVDQISVGKLQDYFTLLPGDKDHQIFQFLQGNVRTKEYVETFRFYDYQIIQMAGLSPYNFGYEKDAYQNRQNIELNANASEMTIEAIKTQIEPQINRLLLNIYKMQKSQGIKENLLPISENRIDWDYGSNERIDDFKKLEILKQILQVAEVPYRQRAEIIAPLIAKINNVDNKELVNEIVEENNKERKALRINFGEI
jgi:hypothetical protein